jgi:hypothetical protein
VFKKNDVRFVSYVPDNVLTSLIKNVTSDNYFISVNAAREDEAMGMVAGLDRRLKGVVMSALHDGAWYRPRRHAGLVFLRGQRGPHSCAKVSLTSTNARPFMPFDSISSSM